MSYCPVCAKIGLRKRVKRKNRKKNINGVWCHKKCPDLTAEEMECAKEFILRGDKKFWFGDPEAEVNYKIVGITDSKIPREE